MMTAPVILAALVIVSCATSIVGSACSACRFCQCETHTLSSRIKTISCVSNDHPLAAHWFEDCGDATLLKLLGTDGDGGSSRVHRHWTRRVFKGREWYATGQQSSWHIQRGVFSHLTALRKLKILQPAFIGSAAFEGLPAQVKVEVAWDYVPLVANPAAAYDPYTGAPYVMADAFDGLAAHVELRFLSTMETRPAVERFLARAWCPPSLRTCTLGEVNIPTGETLREFERVRSEMTQPLMRSFQPALFVGTKRTIALTEPLMMTLARAFRKTLLTGLRRVTPQTNRTIALTQPLMMTLARAFRMTVLTGLRRVTPQTNPETDQAKRTHRPPLKPPVMTLTLDLQDATPTLVVPQTSGCCTPPPLAVAEAELRRRSRIVTAVGLSIIGSVVLLLSGELVFHYIVRRRFLHSIQPKLGSTIFPVAVATGDRVHTFASTL
ncbi:unnamed protein product (mitochondrion) [Plasmodiophora brassicae]|uniref:Uncharacterized protein n=1 Tax=Plasmodiophora brassicae TaxID=37360 RepID=A0A3P3Y1Z0_PLABS|nr:unnamed protein product [Plasmodiophora brassicae]